MQSMQFRNYIYFLNLWNKLLQSKFYCVSTFLLLMCVCICMISFAKCLTSVCLEVLKKKIFFYVNIFNLFSKKNFFWILFVKLVFGNYFLEYFLKTYFVFAFFVKHSFKCSFFVKYFYLIYFFCKTFFYLISL